MTQGHAERLLMADADYDAAKEFRAVAEESMRLRERAVELYTAVGGEAPLAARQALAVARAEYKQFNRICLRHSARQLDGALRKQGKYSETESAVILFDVMNPVLEIV